jgi:hypothetical protein
MNELIPMLFLGGMVLIFIATYILNKLTPVPESALSDAEEAACKSCNIVTCSRHGSEE